jgi:hypothetical protein
MRKFITVIFFCILGLITSRSYAQKDGPSLSDTLDNVLLEQQWSLGAHINTNGWGFKYRRGHNVHALRQFMWEIEFTTYKAAKEVKTINSNYSDSKSFVYGKLILNRKPYWGGVQLSWIYYGGFSLGLAQPVYLYISDLNNNTVTQERYDPKIHFLDNIYGRGAFLTGILNTGLHPGIYVKSGLEFEFGTRNRAIKALEVGATLDYSPIPIAIMANNPEQSFFLAAYISVSIGKRYNK